jgi:hypothetical protein
MAKEIFVSFGVDIDAVAGWLGSYGGEDSPTTSPADCSPARWRCRGSSSCSAARG